MELSKGLFETQEVKRQESRQLRKAENRVKNQEIKSQDSFGKRKIESRIKRQESRQRHNNSDFSPVLLLAPPFLILVLGS